MDGEELIKDGGQIKDGERTRDGAELRDDGLLRLEVGPVAHGGHCVARYRGRVVFVRHALPGETVLARLTDGGERAKFWRADAVEVLVAAPGRVEPPCPLAGPGRCGGCDWQHAEPATQRALKADVITEQLQRLAHLEPGRDGVPAVLVEAVPVPGRDTPDDYLGWRTRVGFAVDGSGRTGLRRHRSLEVIPVRDCRIADPRITGLDLGAQRWPGTGAVEAIVPAEGDPLVVVTAAETGTAGRRTGGAGAVAKNAAAALKLPRLPVPAAVATRDETGLHQVRGRTWASEQVLVDGEVRRFRVTGTGFWQVHPGAAQTLLDAVLAAADPRPGERALDLYGGVGLFAAGLARRVGPNGSVTLIESDGRAVADGRRSLHDLDTVRFETGPVEHLLPRVTRSSGRSGTGGQNGKGAVDGASGPGEPSAEGVDIVVLDPPRSGAGRAVIERIAALTPRVIVYVACDPAALARDLATAATAGYRLAQLRAFDLFPMTHHVECVATLIPSPDATAAPGELS